MRTFVNTIVCIIFVFGSATAQTGKMTIEAPSADPTLIVRGPEKEINYVNITVRKEKKGLYLFSEGFGDLLKHRTNYAAIQVNNQMKVVRVVKGAENSIAQSSSNADSDLSIPAEGFVLIAIGESGISDDFTEFLAENFHKGDLVKLRINGEIVSLEQLLDRNTSQTLPALVLDGESFRTSSRSKETIRGFVSNFPKGKKCRVESCADGKITEFKCDSKGRFSGNVELNLKTNYITLSLAVNNEKVQQIPLTIYRKNDTYSSSEIIMWVEQFPNAVNLISDEKVEEMVLNAKRAGFTAIAFDVKGPEGYVSYRKNNLSHTPYFTQTVNPKKKVADNGFDLLNAILIYGHKHGLRIYTSFNFFTEGNITANDYAVLNHHKDWEEVVQRPEDKGLLLSVRESNHGKDAAAGKKIALAFVNPVNKEVQDFQLLRVEEVLQNYPVDGIVLDRCRYDNLYADFSHVTRNAFANYLTTVGKRLENFPNDAFLIDETGTLCKGKFFNEWITFRSLTIKEFTDRVRSLVDKYKQEKNPDLKMAAYVGSWYEVYYQNGVNWASPDFKYDSRLNFPESSLYNDSYSKTSYLDNLDFLMIGTYYKTGKEVSRYITLGNILTNGSLPVLGSMSLPDLKSEEQAGVFRASLETSSGLMIFDHCYIKWPEFIQNMTQAIGGK